MKINSINNNSQTNSSFRAMQVHSSAKPIIANMKKSDQLSLDVWKKLLSTTKYFDLHVLGRDNKFLLTIASKTDEMMKSKAPLYGIDQNANKVLAFGVDLVNPEERFDYALEFSSTKKAREHYNKLIYDEKCFNENKNFLTQFTWAVDSIKALEEAFVFMKGEKLKPQIISAQSSSQQTQKQNKFSIIDKLKMAWNIFKK